MQLRTYDRVSVSGHLCGHCRSAHGTWVPLLPTHRDKLHVSWGEGGPVYPGGC